MGIHLEEKEIKEFNSGDCGERAFISEWKDVISDEKERETKLLKSLSKALPQEITDFNREEIEPIELFTIASHVEKLSDFINKRRNDKYWGLEIPSFPILTNALMGLREITILGANEKEGKSTFVLNIATDIADQGYPVIYYDFENGRENLEIRILCRKERIKYRDELLKKGYDIANKIESGLSRFRNNYNNFAIINDRQLTIGKLRKQISQIRKGKDEQTVLVVIDSLQKLIGNKMNDLKERRAGIDFWLRGFEELKSENPNLIFLIVSELTRGNREFKESGDIEYTAHFLLKLNPDENDSNIKNLHLVCARDVEANKIIAQYKADFDYWEFIEMEDKFL